MSYGSYLKAELRTSWVFFAVFVAIGIGLDMVVYQRPVDWGQRLIIAVFTTIAFVLFAAWQKMRKAQ